METTFKVLKNEPFTVKFENGQDWKIEIYAIHLTKKELEAEADYVCFDKPEESEPELEYPQ